MEQITITVVFFGPLAAQAGEKTIQFDLPTGSTYGDLLDDIGRQFGHRFHTRIWDSRENEFGAGILSIGAGRDLDSRDAPLNDGEEIKIVPVSAGG
jgi:molybdopterin converting factor small subunit